jgi:hypothetical protein
MALIPNYPMVNLGDLYVQGGRMAYVTGATHTFTVTAGQFRDQSNTNDIILTATTPSLLVSGLNGIDTGSVAASTVYYVYAVGSSVYGANDGQDAGAPQGVGPTPGVTTTVPAGTYPASYVPAGILLSTALPSVGPTLPVNYDMWRRIGAIRTTAGSLVEPFVQTGYGNNRTMRYMTPVAPASAAVAGTTSYATIGVLTTIVPQVVCDVILECSMAPATAGDSLYLAPYGNTVAPGGYEARFSAPVVQPAAQWTTITCPCAFNAAGTPIVEVDYATTAGAGTTAVSFVVSGYTDVL